MTIQPLMLIMVPLLAPRSCLNNPGKVYVYLIYGMHHCLNIVAHEDGLAGAVLIRGIRFPNRSVDGPGRVCKQLEITRNHNNLDATQSMLFYITDGQRPVNTTQSPRVGISKAIDRLWRFQCTLEFRNNKNSY